MTLVARFVDPGGWDWGNVAEWLTLVVAVLGAVFAVRQLRDAAKANRDAWRIQQGVQLMQIDDKYETTLQESRKAIERLQLECQAAIDGGDGRPFAAVMSARRCALTSASPRSIPKPALSV